eukprot:CAMPEP_0115568498 /NCGR_PEP_ID=MMETSP0271-20121206/104703_1 /TAXON_ID=71861 /ORGANISM="Scrippsiella trochoidea, Strain CCMP3099" /LENGTH=101 /DNA_ID=CAMNT_0003002983 /DNA_START=288 /DNA_END=590 /DNA_ORIENTATION=-
MSFAARSCVNPANPHAPLQVWIQQAPLWLHPPSSRTIATRTAQHYPTALHVCGVIGSFVGGGNLERRPFSKKVACKTLESWGASLDCCGSAQSMPSGPEGA